MITTDADWEGSHETVDLMNCYPGVDVDLYAFAKEMAFYNSGPVTFQLVQDADSNTRLRFTLDFTDAQGKQRRVTSKYYHALLYEAAVLEQKARDAKAKARNKKVTGAQQPVLIGIGD